LIHDLETDVHRSLISPVLDPKFQGAEQHEPVIPPTSSGPTIAPAVADNQAKTRRVLIADDVASTRRFLRAVLEHCQQFDVAGEASDGESAIEMAGLLQPDLVLLDLSMPLTEGASALIGIRAVAPDASVVIVSGMSPELGGPLLEAGATAFLPKGIPPFELLERLGDILNQSLTVECRSGWESILSDQRAIVCVDDPETRHRVTQVLEGCQVVVTAETDTASTMLEVIGFAKPGIIVLDLFVNGKPDVTIVSEVCHRSPQSAVIVYSTFAGWKEEAIVAGATAFVLKPRIEELAQQIRRVTGAL
jgi:DNA-binding NarL/FixJ family response regulator